MRVYESELYQEDVKLVSDMGFPWEKLKGKAVMISGATGLIGSFLIDVLMKKNVDDSLDCNVYALGRNEKRAFERFGYCFDNKLFHYKKYDVNNPLKYDGLTKIDYVLHLASNTHPVQYSTDPIGTITTNIIGLQNMLEFALGQGTERVMFASSNEIYGENKGDFEKFDEGYCGYIDCNTMRAGYSESKRCSESLCQAYIVQKKMDIVIPRFTRSYGPTLLDSDTKALSQFLHKAVAKENIVLKSAGTQYYSYTYVADAVSGLLAVLLYGKNGEAYNISHDASDIMLKDLAALVAECAGTEVVFEVPDAREQAGYSKATKARLDSSKLQKLGWQAKYDIREGVARTIKILSEIG